MDYNKIARRINSIQQRAIAINENRQQLDKKLKLMRRPAANLEASNKRKQSSLERALHRKDARRIKAMTADLRSFRTYVEFDLDDEKRILLKSFSFKSTTE